MALVDVQHFWLCLREMSAVMIGERPGDGDVKFLWATFTSCVKVLDMIGKVNVKVLKIILGAQAPNTNDHNNPDKYIKMICAKSEDILNEIGWPDDVGGT